MALLLSLSARLLRLHFDLPGARCNARVGRPLAAFGAGGELVRGDLSLDIHVSI